VTTHFVYGLNGELLGEYVSGTTPDIEYVYLNGQPVAVISSRWESTTPPPTILTVDNDDAGTSSSGTWTSKIDPQAYGPDHRLGNKSASATYRWTINYQIGVYADVEANWVEHNSHSSSVAYTIVHDGGTDVVVKSHKANGGVWNPLGGYTGIAYVEVNAADGKTSADAVRFVTPGTPEPPVLTEYVGFIHTDHLGTPRAVSDDTQSAVWRWDSTPFGEGAPDEDPDGDSNDFVLNLRFPGQYHDAESGLHYNYFRDYDPSVGRYVESDPSGLADGTNLFNYAQNSPSVYFDPFGLWVKRCSRGLGGPTKPPKDPNGHNPLRHDFIVVSGNIFSFQSGGSGILNLLHSQGRIDDNEQLNDKCVTICEDESMDVFVREAINEIGAPTYCVGAYPGTPEYKAGARNCQTWADDVLSLARKKYLEANSNSCPTC
jgi:RHS repeat-associated protein